MKIDCLLSKKEYTPQWSEKISTSTQILRQIFVDYFPLNLFFFLFPEFINLHKIPLQIYIYFPYSSGYSAILHKQNPNNSSTYYLIDNSKSMIENRPCHTLLYFTPIYFHRKDHQKDRY